MKILYLTDMDYIGFLTHDFQMGYRPPMSWISSLNSFHCSYNNINKIPYNDFDITIMGCLHENVNVLEIDMLKIQSISKKILFQHDSDHRYFYQKNSLSRSYMLNYIISNVDAILTHNDLDKKYYETLYKKPCFIHEQLILDVYDKVKSTSIKQGVILGGIKDRYGALDGYMLSSNITDEKIFCFGEEEVIPDLNYIPNTWDYISYNQRLFNFKFALNLTPFAIGGSFPLQCAMLKVPCLGWNNSNPLKTCYPELVAEYGDFDTLRNNYLKLINDDIFYNQVTEYAREMFLTYYNITKYKNNLKHIFDSI